MRTLKQLVRDYEKAKRALSKAQAKAFPDKARVMFREKVGIVDRGFSAFPTLVPVRCPRGSSVYIEWFPILDCVRKESK